MLPPSLERSSFYNRNEDETFRSSPDHIQPGSAVAHEPQTVSTAPLSASASASLSAPASASLSAPAPAPDEARTSTNFVTFRSIVVDSVTFITHPSRFAFWNQPFQDPDQPRVIDAIGFLTVAKDSTFFPRGIRCHNASCSVILATLEEMTSHIEDAHSDPGY